ncbi:hypothetical protein DFH94DRAFT_723783 [Russula ochroleuca]|uniref:Uncharacterized protein n=1 Tax=Russula ochroleuca TaxID=152965 RepID=A0A9P5TBU4_9AGAM|nr:hypothetical protein DFH94DRAFT_723783 [Russula ochroleuca]
MGSATYSASPSLGIVSDLAIKAPVFSPMAHPFFAIFFLFLRFSGSLANEPSVTPTYSCGVSSVILSRLQARPHMPVD